MLSRGCFHETIELHELLTENPYTKEFAFGNAPSHAEVKDFLVQLSVFQKMFLSWSDRDDFRFNQLRELASKVPIDPAKDLNGYMLGSSASATRETAHCLHQLGRSYGSKNESVKEGARAALRARASHGAQEDPAVENSLWQITEGFRHHNRVYRKDKAHPPLPLDFFEHSIAVVAQYGDCFKETQRRIAAIPDFQITDWCQGAKMALDAVYLFWIGLEERRKKLR